MKQKHWMRSLNSTLALLAMLASCSGDEQRASPGTPKNDAPVAPLVEKTAMVDWCPEHGVPESVCTRCNPQLVAAFQAKGDWCKEHGVPASQCIACKPELKAKFAAMAPKK